MTIPLPPQQAEKTPDKTLTLKQQFQAFFKRKENVVGFSVLATSISLVLVSVFFFRSANLDNRQIALYTQDATPTPYATCITNANCEDDSLCKQVGSSKECVPFDYPECKDSSTCQRANANGVCVNYTCVNSAVSCDNNGDCNSVQGKPFCISGSCQALSYPYCKTNSDCGTSQYCGEVVNGIGKCQFKITATPTKTQVNNQFSPTPVQSGGNQSEYCDNDAQCQPNYKMYCADHSCVEITQGYCKSDIHCSYLTNGKCVTGLCEVQLADGSHTIPTATYAPESGGSHSTVPTRTPTPAGESASNRIPTATPISGNAGHDNSSNTSGSQQGGSNGNTSNPQAGGQQTPVGNTNPGDAASHNGENGALNASPTPQPIKNPIAKVANSVNKAVDAVVVSVAKFLANLFMGK